MNPNSDCISETVLFAYIGQHEHGPQVAAIELHLASCADCLHRLGTLQRNVGAPQIPDCHVIGEIGRGRFGVVYKAFWKDGDCAELIALKVLSNPGSMEESRFDREIAVLKHIHAPGIVKLRHAATAGGTRYYIMDFIRGCHLDEFLATRAATLHNKLRVLERVCRAVAAAHEHGVVHRDLKPSNILVDDEGQPHILDFGICALLEEDAGSWADMTLTRPGDVVGTLKYMSPEQAWGGVAGHADARSDLWSLGILLHEIVSDGALPFSLSSTRDKPAAEAVLERIRKETPKIASVAHLPDGKALQTILQRCLSWDRRHRMASASQMADDLALLIEGKDIKTKRLAILHRARRLAVGVATKARWAFAATFIAGVGIALWVVAFACNVGWYEVGYRLGAAPGGAISGGGAPSARDVIRVVAVTDDTSEQVIRFADEQDIENVSADITTWRAVHGYLMHRLIAARPLAVVWDYYFSGARPGDTDLVAGIQALEASGVPVVLAVNEVDDWGLPRLSEAILSQFGSELRFGSIRARDMVHRPGDIVLVSRPKDQAPVPGIGLTTLAAVLHPNARLEIEWEGRRSALTVLYRVREGSYLRERHEIPLNSVYERSDIVDGRTRPVMVGCATFEIQRPELWDGRTVPYHALLAAPDEVLTKTLGNRIVLVGDLRTDRAVLVPDRHSVRFGAEVVGGVPGCYLLAEGMAGLFDRRHVRSARFLSPFTLLTMMGVAAIGCLLSIRVADAALLRQPGTRLALAVITAGLCCLAIVVVVLSRSFWLVHGGMAVFALFSAMIGATWVELARNQYRILDERWRAATGLETHVGSDVSRKPGLRRWLPAAR